MALTTGLDEHTYKLDFGRTSLGATSTKGRKAYVSAMELSNMLSEIPVHNV
jgi:hypothetical protein